MYAEPHTAAHSTTSVPGPRPRARAPAYVPLTKKAHTRLLRQVDRWKAAHREVAASLKQLTLNHQAAMAQAAQREADLRVELETAQGKVRDLQKRVFGRKSEQRSRPDAVPGAPDPTPRSRGQQPGTRGHGRRMLPHLPARVETVEIDSPHCQTCGLGYVDFPGVEESEVVEIEVKAYRRVIRRRRYRKTCQCCGVPGIISAPSPARLIPKGKYGISIWVQLLLSKFMYGQPTHRSLQEMLDSGLTLKAGTVTGGLRTIAPLFEPIVAKLLIRLRSESHWHADETRWQVFIEVEGKIGHRWYMWIFQSKSVIHYVLDPSRSARVPIAELGEAEGGIMSVDRYVVYKTFARLNATFILAFCWAHVRRDFFKLANSYPDLATFAFAWVDKIGELYHLNGLRLKSQADAAGFETCDRVLRQAIDKMALDRAALLNEPSLADPARAVLQSMQNHWPGLTVFVDHPEIPMDNNPAERTVRHAVVGRKNFYGSGSQWSGELTATMYSVLLTVKLWELNPRTWLSTYLHACAENGNQPPSDLNPFLPWTMSAEQTEKMKRVFVEPNSAKPEGFDSS